MGVATGIGVAFAPAFVPRLAGDGNVPSGLTSAGLRCAVAASPAFADSGAFCCANATSKPKLRKATRAIGDLSMKNGGWRSLYVKAARASASLDGRGGGL